MKSLLPFLAGALALFCTSGAVAQQAVPNNGFETWTQRGPVEAPTSWLTTDDLVAALGSPLPFSTNTVVKSTDRRGGSFAARLQNQDLLGQLTLPGLVVLGTRFNLDADFPGGVPYTSRPARMQLYYKLTGPAAGNDSAAVQVALTRTVNGDVRFIAGAVQILAPQSNYTLLDLPLTYLQGGTPDTLRMIMTSGNAKNITIGTSLFVDDISFTGTVQASQNPALNAALTVYPNPSPSGEFRLSSPSDPAVATAPYTITDATGHVVRTAAAAPLSQASNRAVELRGLPAGLYLLQLSTPEGPLTRKLLVP